MLSYQHNYHAGCLADVHKHAFLCALLDVLTRKDKPLTYFETHAGRGLYDLNSDDALKTGEAQLGIQKLMDSNTVYDERYMPVLKKVQEKFGKTFYPGSPMIADLCLRDADQIHLMELHPQEIENLKKNMKCTKAKTHHRDGYEGVLALSPPTPARGMVLIDPSFEVKTEYDDVVSFIAKLHKKWAVGVIALWYPILKSGIHKDMVTAIKKTEYPKMLLQEVSFPSLSDRRGMKGSGMLVINAPYGLAEEIEKIPDMFMNG